MHRSIASILLLGLPLLAQAQEANLHSLLEDVEANNPALEAYRHRIESRELEHQTRNNLPDPTGSAYYLPGVEGDVPTYTEFEVSQRLAFPTLYWARKDWIEEKKEALEQRYASFRQKVLLKTKKLALRLIHVQKRIELEQERMERAEKVFQHTRALYDKEEVGKPVLQKAKVARMQTRFRLAEQRTEKENLFTRLKGLNGGNPVEAPAPEYPLKLRAMNADSLWAERDTASPALKRMKGKEGAARQKVRVEKQKALPTIEAGYNYQGFPGGRNAGFLAGISIPLWNSKDEVKRAEATLDQRKAETRSSRKKLSTRIRTQAHRYNSLLSKYRTYQSTLSGMESQKLLRQSWKKGKISFLDYYRESRFYREAKDRMLATEKELQILLAEMTQHTL